MWQNINVARLVFRYIDGTLVITFNSSDNSMNVDIYSDTLILKFVLHKIKIN